MIGTELLRELIETVILTGKVEGITRIATPGGIEKFEDGKRGIIASLTYSLVKDARHWWNKIGFTSRMLPFCYMYPADLIVQIKADIDLQQQYGNNGTAPPAN